MKIVNAGKTCLGFVHTLLGMTVLCVLMLAEMRKAYGQKFAIGDRILVVRNKMVEYDNGQSEALYPATVLQIRGVESDGRLKVRWSRRASISTSHVVPVSEYGEDIMRGWLRRQPCTANRINLGAALLLDGQFQDALFYFQRALRGEPNSPWACNALGWFYATCPAAEHRDGERAIEYCQRACEISEWQESMFVTSLACAYAEHQEFDRAIELIKKALMMDEKFRGVRAAMLKNFEDGQAYRATELLAS